MNNKNNKNKLNIMVLLLVLSIQMAAGCDEANGVNASQSEAVGQEKTSQKIVEQKNSDLIADNSKTSEQESEKAQKSSDNAQSRKDNQGKNDTQDKSDSQNKSDSQSRKNSQNKSDSQGRKNSQNKSDSTNKSDSQNKSKSQKKKSQNKKESQSKKAEDKSRKSEKKVKKGWIFYGSRSTELTGKEKARLDSMVKSWTSGSISENSLEEKMCAYLTKQGKEIVTAGIMGRSRCLFESVNDIPDYSALLKERHGLYNFIGLYTEGKYDSSGHLICYYWEAGVM